MANIQVVTVNGETWHRVRIGPIEGARRRDEMRRMLQDNGIETLVLKGSPKGLFLKRAHTGPALSLHLVDGPTQKKPKIPSKEQLLGLDLTDTCKITMGCIRSSGRSGE